MPVLKPTLLYPRSSKLQSLLEQERAQLNTNSKFYVDLYFEKLELDEFLLGIEDLLRVTMIDPGAALTLLQNAKATWLRMARYKGLELRRLGLVQKKERKPKPMRIHRY